MKQNYLQIQTYTGWECSDLHHERHQILHNNRPEIPDIRTAIIDDICTRYPLADRTKIEEIYDNPISNSQYVAPVRINKHEQTTVTIKWKNSCFYTELAGQYTENVYYVPQQIEKENVMYIPIHAFVVNVEEGDTKDRFFHKPFDTYEEAVAYQQTWIEMHPEDELMKEAWSDDYDEVMVFNKSSLKQDEKSWYGKNMRAIELMSELEIDPMTCAGFPIDAKSHIEALEERLNKTFSMK